MRGRHHKGALIHLCIGVGTTVYIKVSKIYTFVVWAHPQLFILSGRDGRGGVRVLMSLSQGTVLRCRGLFSAVPMLLPWAPGTYGSCSGSPPTWLHLPPCHRRWLDTYGSASLEKAPRWGRVPFAEWKQGRLQRAVSFELVKSIDKCVDGSSEGVIRVQLPLQAVHKVLQPPLRALCRRVCHGWHQFECEMNTSGRF